MRIFLTQLLRIGEHFAWELLYKIYKAVAALYKLLQRHCQNLTTNASKGNKIIKLYV